MLFPIEEPAGIFLGRFTHTLRISQAIMTNLSYSRGLAVEEPRKFHWKPVYIKQWHIIHIKLEVPLCLTM